ncbi:hypothetical protein ACFRAU_14220 [Arthrobacter sp. NPDC056691]|uniref:hypothetical protein n=1 Tax=Arthrobacter sp. NPDC056691 TaxID=3345913 RepID=UPI00366C8198
MAECGTINGKREGVDELPQYEFKTVKVPRGRWSRDAAINRYGAKGWEVIQVRDVWQGTVTVSMKRIKPEKPKRKEEKIAHEMPVYTGGGFWRWFTGRR